METSADVMFGKAKIGKDGVAEIAMGEIDDTGKLIVFAQAVDSFAEVTSSIEPGRVVLISKEAGVAVNWMIVNPKP
jgi:hypothetical protein